MKPITRTVSPFIRPMLVAALLLAPQIAEAHVVQGEANGFGSGFRHPITGFDHIIAMLAVGMWGAQLGKPAIWVLPLTFPLVMAIGGFFGLAGAPLPGAEIGIALSGVTLGAAVLSSFRAPLWIVAAVVGMFGLCHGYAHGAEMPPGHDPLPYSLGFVVATGLLHAAGIATGLLHRWNWGQYVLRAAGAGVLMGGVFFLWRAFA